MEQDDRPRGPQGAAGVIDESVARRIKECARQDCISQALKAVESNGMMMGTPEVAEKLQQMFFLESIFIDQATLNGTRPVSPEGAEPALATNVPITGGWLRL